MLDTALRVKLADFGLSREKQSPYASMGAGAGGQQLGYGSQMAYSSAYNTAAPQLMTGYCGTVQWMAPEVLRCQKYTFSADVFSLGVVIWEVAALQVSEGGRERGGRGSGWAGGRGGGEIGREGERG
jgi:serine/threonine protein kinase